MRALPLLAIRPYAFTSKAHRVKAMVPDVVLYFLSLHRVIDKVL